MFKVNKTAFHLVFWLCAWLFWVFIFRNGTLVITRAVTIQFCYLAFIAANYYFNAHYNIPHLLDKKRYAAFVICFILGIVMTALIRVPVFVLVYRYIFKIEGAQLNYLSIFYNSLINILFWVGFILTGRMIVEKIRAEIYIEQIEKEKAANELNFLRAQFNPHFLFNSINSIYGHIDKSNKGARSMLLVFSEMLRYQLYECNVEQIELDRELNYIRNYIALQKSRMDDRILVNFCAEHVNGSVEVAPLLLITFIENAFKYVGFNECRENRIDIRLHQDNDSLIFRIFNTRDTFINHSEKSSGLGIDNAKRRLELLYPNRHQLEINDREYYYDITLTLYGI